jgi:phage head maturation protease
LPDAPTWIRGTELAGLTPRTLSWVAMAVESASAATGEISFIASTGEVDRMGDSIHQESWVLDHYNHNGVVLADHDGTKVIGRGRAELVDTAKGKQLLLHATFDDEGPNELAKLISHQHKNGWRKAVSVGFIPGKATSRRDLPKDHPLYVSNGDVPRWMSGYLFESPELLEVSSVGIPALRSALQLDSIADTHRRGHQFLPPEWVRDIGAIRGANDSAFRESLLHSLRSDPEVRRAMQAAYLGQPVTEKPTTAGPRWVG